MKKIILSILMIFLLVGSVLAIGNAFAQPVMFDSKGKGKPVEPTPPTYDEMLAKSISWIKDRQAPSSWSLSGMVISLEKKAYPHGFTYDQALAVIALASHGDTADAKIILEKLGTIQNTDGSWYNKYNLETGGASDTAKYSGSHAWTIYSIAYSVQKTSEQIFVPSAVRAADYLITLQSANGGIYGGYNSAGDALTWKSTEHNIAAYYALRDLGKVTGKIEYTTAADEVKNWLVTVAFNAQEQRFNTGENDASAYLDAQTLGVLFLKSISQDTHVQNVINFAENSFQVKIKGSEGFDFDSNKDNIWLEGTGQMSLAYVQSGNQQKSEFFTEEVMKTDLKDDNDGGIKYYIRKGGADQISPTTWLIFAINKIQGYDSLFLN